MVSKVTKEKTKRSTVPNLSFVTADGQWFLSEFAEEAGIPLSTISKWRRNEGFPVRDIGHGIVFGADVKRWIAERPLKARNVNHARARAGSK